jgi:hypothetical protein
MAKVTYIDPIKSISGKLAKKHKTAFCVRTAPTNNPDMITNPCYTNYRDPKFKKAPTAAMSAWRETWKEITAATRARLINPSQMTQDRLDYINQTKYKTLWAFVWNLEKERIMNGE